jgi:hypothetical protein
MSEYIHPDSFPGTDEGSHFMASTQGFAASGNPSSPPTPIQSLREIRDEQLNPNYPLSVGRLANVVDAIIKYLEKDTPCSNPAASTASSPSASPSEPLSVSPSSSGSCTTTCTTDDDGGFADAIESVDPIGYVLDMVKKGDPKQIAAFEAAVTRAEQAKKGQPCSDSTDCPRCGNTHGDSCTCHFAASPAGAGGTSGTATPASAAGTTSASTVASSSPTPAGDDEHPEDCPCDRCMFEAQDAAASVGEARCVVEGERVVLDHLRKTN